MPASIQGESSCRVKSSLNKFRVDKKLVETAINNIYQQYPIPELIQSWLDKKKIIPDQTLIKPMENEGIRKVGIPTKFSKNPTSKNLHETL